MKHYYLTIRAYQAKNLAQGELQKFIYQYDNFLVDEEGLKNIMSRITREIDRINLEYKRCKDITISEMQLPDVLSFSFATVDHFGIGSLNAADIKGYELSEDIEKSYRW